MNTRRLTPVVHRLAMREWLALFVFLLIVTISLGWQNGLGRLDQSLYDLFLSSRTEPVREDIIIVAIDDYSIAELGRWPWPRHHHADIIEQIGKSKPLAIGLDVILSEADTRHGNDKKLTSALQHSQRAVLPVVMMQMGKGVEAGLPTPALSAAARALGHINLEHDDDGVVRSVYLQEGQYGQWWPHFSAALLAIGKGEKTETPSLAPAAQSADASDEWLRTQKMLIPFRHGVASLPAIPYVSVLRGEVPDSFFAGKYVLIGATALGMADAYPTPISGSTGAMPGIEIHANVLSSLLDEKYITPANTWQTILFNLLPVFCVLLSYLHLSPRLSLVATGTGVLTTLAISYASLMAGFWLPPFAAILVLGVAYPLWSWRRLEAAITYLGQEFIRLDREPHVLPEVQATPEVADILTQRITAMEKAAHRVRDLRQFVSDSLDSMPDATFITSLDGHLLLANRHAVAYGASLQCTLAKGHSILSLLQTLDTPRPLQSSTTPFHWEQLFDLQHSQYFSDGIAAQDKQGRDLLVKNALSHSSADIPTGWIISIIDISPIRAAERGREETLRFLSHDMRGPQASILALLELQKEAASALPQEELFARIEKASRRTLGLADNFVQLARAESAEYRCEEIDFHDVLFDAADEIWSLARSRQITIQIENAKDDCPVNVDRTLMTRALTNLLANAIAYSPEHTVVTCTLTTQGTQVYCSIQDQGYGIALEDQARLFQRFQHMESPDNTRHDGVGLGLVFVKTVVERHHGDISLTSKPGSGTTFTLALPLHTVA